MNAEEFLVSPELSIRQVMEQINRSGQGIVLIADEDRRLLATITDGDIRRSILNDIDLNLPIQELVQRPTQSPKKPPVTAPKGTSDAELLKLMTDHTVRHIPVVDGQGRILAVAALTELIQEYELPMTAVVMAGGYGARLRPLTDDLPKPMLPVGGRPLLELIIEQLTRAGIKKVNLTTHYKKEAILDHFGDGSDFGVEIQYVEEDRPLGTAGALGRMKHANETQLVINGDILTRVDFRAMLDFHKEHGAELTVALTEHESTLPYGVVEIDGVSITRITEKPVTRQLINAGIYLLEPSAAQSVPSTGSYDMTDLISQLIAEDRRVVGFPVKEYWLDIGHQDDYTQAQVDAKKEGLA